MTAPTPSGGDSASALTADATRFREALEAIVRHYSVNVDAIGMKRIAAEALGLGWPR